MSDGVVLRKDVPPEIPADVDGPEVERACGVVGLPITVAWSDVDRTYDLDDRYDRVRAYELVLAEGTADDVRRFIRIDDLIELWDDLWLPRAVESAWAYWLREQRGAGVRRRHRGSV